MFSPSQISCKLQAVFQSAQNLSSDFVECSCVVVATTTPKRHEIFSVLYKYWETDQKRIWKIYDYVEWFVANIWCHMFIVNPLVPGVH